MNNEEILKYLSESGIIDISSIQQDVEMKKIDKLVNDHPYKYWYGKDEKWHVYLPDIKKGRILKNKNTEEEIRQVIAEYQKSIIDNPTIEELFNEWNDRRLELKKISHPTYERNKSFYDRHYKEFGKKRIKSVSSDDFANFLEEQIPKHNLTAKAFAGLKGITKGILKRAKRQNLITWNVEEMLFSLDISESDFKKTIKEDYEEVFNEQEMALLIDYILNHQDLKNIGILLMFVTGLRVGELCTLKHEDIHDNCIDVRRTETRIQKEGTNKYDYLVKDYPKTRAGIRTVAVPRQFQEIVVKLWWFSSNTEYVFEEKGKRLTAQKFRSRLSLLCRELGIYHKSPHKIRKTYGSILLDNGVDKRTVLDQMGHEDINVSETHYHRNRKSLEKKLDMMSAIPEFQLKVQ